MLQNITINININYIEKKIYLLLEKCLALSKS